MSQRHVPCTIRGEIPGKSCRSPLTCPSCATLVDSGGAFLDAIKGLILRGGAAIARLPPGFTGRECSPTECKRKSG